MCDQNSGKGDHCDWLMLEPGNSVAVPLRPPHGLLPGTEDLDVVVVDLFLWAKDD